MSEGIAAQNMRPDVVAGKYDPSLFTKDGTMLLVNEIFYSFQGEGLFAGRPAVFVRLAKCNLKCKFCDTEFERYTPMKPLDIVRAVGDAIQAKTLYSARQQYTLSSGIVILTGGEPALQNCEHLLHMLHAEKYQVHIETSGSVWSEWMRDLDFITVSPKVLKHRIPKPLLDTIRFNHTRHIHAPVPPYGQVKWIVNSTFEKMYNADPLSVYIEDVPNCLQPESMDPGWTRYAIDIMLRYQQRYTLSLQQHKIAGMP